ncbi:right-handed parallel beta-helix repeat-containing protein [Breznakiella homolactica]|uniref:Right-handed parallel beta-helix repeat-containing protein n=1 Tax=Breznakiella homolactica TaxID=2798577 RepID=A0A7T7XKA1_9SPIR|nr:right-handed parallel beta-helix repeat-containing protein [Breznakiella homolactica]QQO07812.1 right-handed parallel beta-helix repeat-containing protein [Breznakiella homolactica]
MKKELLILLICLISLGLAFTGCPNPSGSGTTNPGGNTDPGENEIIYAEPLTDVFYVRPSTQGTGDGSSWTNAFGDLQDAIEEAYAAASSGNQKYVFILEGTYTPSGYPNLTGEQTDTRLKHFSLRNNVTVIGGFKGDEKNMIPVGNVTILSGDIGVRDDETDNTYHVFYHPNGTGLTGDTKLENVTITGGNANGSSPHIYGGGIYNYDSSPTITDCTISGSTATTGGGGIFNNNNSNPAITNCTISNNNSSVGGGIFNNNGSSPTIINCTISNNNASSYGGGIYNYDNSPVITNCTISGNTATDQGGGGIYNYNSRSSPTITNCTITGNTATAQGGGIFNNYSNPVITNCTISGNTATAQGGGIYNDNSSHILFGSILAGNIAPNDPEFYGGFNNKIEDSLIKGDGSNGTTVITNLNLLFADIDNEGKAVLKNYGGPTLTLKIKQNSYTEIDLTGVSGWTVPGADQRGFTRSTADDKAYKGSVDPRVKGP